MQSCSKIEVGGWLSAWKHNLIASSKDPRELLKKLKTVLRVQLEAGKAPFSTLPPVRHRFWKLFQNAEPWGLDDSITELPIGAPTWTELAVQEPLTKTGPTGRSCWRFLGVR